MDKSVSTDIVTATGRHQIVRVRRRRPCAWMFADSLAIGFAEQYTSGQSHALVCYARRS